MIGKMRNAAWAALFALLAGSTAASAQSYPSDYQQDYPDSYGDSDISQTVARLSYITGDVAFSRGDEPDNWQPADPNVPMTIGDRVWTGNGRLELEIQGGNVVRMAKRTSLAALNLTEDTTQLSLTSGIASFRIRRLDDYEVFEVDTPNGAITFETPGDYRVDVRSEAVTRVQVRLGRAMVASGGGQVPLGAGDAILLEGYESPRYDFVALGTDGWDRWVLSRDNRYAQVRSYQYVSPTIAGVEDLDGYGQWQQLPSYGWGWSPSSVGTGWAPYRAGRWMWQDPWGWTWVSTERWGWAPYHYGRWVTVRSRWFWIPVGPRVIVPYRPALVAFVGGGPGFSVAVGVGADYIGWFPLAPHEPFVPWWGRPSVNVNINVTNVTYVNRTYVTVVNQGTFVGGQAVASNYVRDRAIINRVERAPVVAGAIPVYPTRESLRVSTRSAPAPRPPAQVLSRPVVARLAPPPAPPRFEEKSAVIRQNRGAPVNPVEAHRMAEKRDQLRPPVPVRPVARETGRVELAPKTRTAPAAGRPAVQPQPVTAPRGRELATRERPVAAEPPQRPARRPAPAAAPARQEPATPERVVPQRPQQRETPQDQPQREAATQRETQQREAQEREAAQQQKNREAQQQRELQQRELQQRELQQRELQQRELQQRQQQQRETAQREALQREAEEREAAQQKNRETQQQQRELQQRQQQQREAAQRETQQREAQRQRVTAPSSEARRAPAPTAVPERDQAPPQVRERTQPPERVAPPPRATRPQSVPVEEDARPTPQRGRPGPKPTPTERPGG